MISKEENGPFTPTERLSILQSLHDHQTEHLSADLLHTQDINKKVENETDSEFKKKFMVFQWFNKLKYTGNKIDLPVFSFDTMVDLNQINKSFPKILNGS
jgi:hypothetical protein